MLSIYLSLICLVLYNFNDLGKYFFIDSNYTLLTTFYLTTGAALIGTTVLVFTLVMFAMQVNVERMPHGLFHKLSSDKRIVLCFFGTFSLSVITSSLSLLGKCNYSTVVFSILFYLFNIVTIIVIFIYAYKRALLLINPMQQLNIVISEVNKDIKFWIRAYKRIGDNHNQRENNKNTDYDITKLTFFNSNPNWTFQSYQALKYSMAFTHKYSSQGDYEVSKAALDVIVLLNQNYIKVKGKTFFNSNGFIELIPTTDGFINETLENLRKAIKIAISNEDEQFIEQLLNTFLLLVNVYSKIEYPSNNYSKTHALLANGYLESAIKSLIPYEMTDVLMEASRILRKSSTIIINTCEPFNLKSIIDTLQILSFLGLLKEKNGPVTLISMEQLSKISLELILNTNVDSSFILKDIRKSLTSIAKMYINTPSKPMSLTTNIDPYFSHLSTQGFLESLTQIVNTLLQQKPKQDNYLLIIQNIERWSNQLYIDSKELLLLSIEKQSSFISYILNWIKIVTELLMTISTVSLDSENMKKELQKNALFLINTFTWIPKNKNSIQLVENYQFTELIFELILKSYQRECEKITTSLIEFLSNWGFEAGKIDNSYLVCEKSIYALCTLTFKIDSFNSKDLITLINKNKINLDDEFKQSLSKRIKSKSYSLHSRMATYSTIEYHMISTNITEMRTLLNEIADLL